MVWFLHDVCARRMAMPAARCHRQVAFRMTRDCLHNVMVRCGIEGILTNVDRYEATNTKLTALWINQRLHLPLAKACGYPTMQRLGNGIPSRSHKRSNRRRKHPKKTPRQRAMGRLPQHGGAHRRIAVTPCRDHSHALSRLTKSSPPTLRQPASRQRQ